MTFKILMRAYPLLQQFLQLSGNAQQSYQLYKFLKQVQEDVDFYVQEEKKLIEKYAANVEQDGQISFDDKENQKLFSQEINNLQNMELPQLMNTITIPLKSIQNIQLTPADFYLLENIINFVEEE